MADQRSLFEVVIQAIDKLSEPFEKMERQVSHFNAPLREIGERVTHLGEAAGIERVTEGFHKLRESIGEAGEKLGEFVGPLAALGALGSLAGLAELAVKAGEVGEQLERAAKKIGIGAEELQKLQFAAKANEVPVDALETGMAKLNKTIADAAAGKNKDAANMFRHLGIALRDSHHRVVDAAAVFPKLAAAIQRNEGAAIRTRIAMTAMGRGGAAMLPMMLDGAEGLEKLGEEAEKVGMLSDDQVKASAQMGESFKMLRLTVEGLSLSIGTRLAPTLRPMITHLTEWLQVHREIIATHVEEVVKRIAKALEQVDWEGFVNGVEHAFGDISRFMKNTLGLKGTLVAVAAFMGAPFLGAIAGIVSALLGLATSTIPIVIGAFTLLGAGASGAAFKLALGTETLAGLAGGIPLLRSILGGLSGIFVALGAAIEATPIGWIVTGIAAVAFAGYELYRHWSELPALASTAWNAVTTVIGAAWDGLKTRAAFAWDGVKAAFGTAWDGIAGFAESGWSRVSTVVAAFTGNIAARAAGSWNAVAAVLSAAWENIAGLFARAWARISTVIDAFTGNIAGRAATAWNGVTGALRSAWDEITGIFDRAWSHIQPIVAAITDNAVVRALANAFSTGAPAAVAAGALAAVTPSLPAAGPSLFALDQPAPRSIYDLSGQQNQQSRDDGMVHVKVDFANMPPGARVNTVTTGPVDPQVNVGWNMMLPPAAR